MKLIEPPPSSRNRLLSDMVCSPVSIRAQELFALLRDLRPEAVARPANFAARPRMDTTDNTEDPEVYPWDEPIFQVADGIAVVKVAGPIVKGYDAITCWYFGLCSLDALSAAITELSGRADVPVVIFDFASGGGSARGTPEVGAQIVALSESGKVTLAFVGDMACSAAYWLACACDQVLATSSACVGSIGTYIAFYDYTEMLTKAGIKLELFAAGDLKAIGLTGNPLTDDQRAFLQSTVQRINDRFTGFVKSNRGDIADSTMQGQWFDGEQAVELGLADRVVSGLPEVIASVRSVITPAVATLV